ncbi:DNA methyltransferase [Ornithinimicrobium flavum]|uniref:DNA methyltransferase n=1 Tax=Ornithinimicrobium flavum TaxID=1288636 RepID=UPI00106FD15B
MAKAEASPGVSPRNTLNDLTAKEWLSESVSVWTQRGLDSGGPPRGKDRAPAPAPFSFQDVGRVIAMLTKRNMTVLDPFVGVGSTLKACALLGRRGIGIELNPVFAELARKRLGEELPENLDPSSQIIHEGDARIVGAQLAPNTVDLIVQALHTGES